MLRDLSAASVGLPSFALRIALYNFDSKPVFALAHRVSSALRFPPLGCNITRVLAREKPETSPNRLRSSIFLVLVRATLARLGQCGPNQLLDEARVPLCIYYSVISPALSFESRVRTCRCSACTQSSVRLAEPGTRRTGHYGQLPCPANRGALRVLPTRAPSRPTKPNV